MTGPVELVSQVNGSTVLAPSKRRGQGGHDAGTQITNLAGGSGGSSPLGGGGAGALDDTFNRAGVAGGSGRVIVLFY